MRPQVHRLFFALRPDAELVSKIASAADAIRSTRLLRARWLSARKYHVTVQFLGDFDDPADVIVRATRAGAAVKHVPFEFVLDHATSFPRRFNPPCVLCCAANTESSLHSFWRALGDALAAAGLCDRLEQHFVPHLTIAYGESYLTARISIDPIVWKVRDFVLMDSLIGQSTHRELARWTLRAD